MEHTLNSRPTLLPRFIAKTLGLLYLSFCGFLNAQIVLPIEVFGQNRFGEDDPVTQTVAFNAPSGSSARQFTFRIHGVGFPGKVSVSLNGKPFEQIRNDNSKVTFEQGAKAYGGVGGLWQTMIINLALNSGDGINGQNQVRFRYHGTRGRSMGYRILSFNLLNVAGNQLVSQSQFVDDNPANWSAPIPGSAAVSEGRILWETASLIKAPGQGAIRAKCSMCHTPSGSDLKYFNYTNRSIIERSKYHGLSQIEGENIASYIRSADIVNPGRPWNPPYQPGPGLDDKPGADWAAGAGIDWVLPDEKVQDYLPGRGTDLAAHVDSNRRYYEYNKREIPVKIQFPDWNHWLPEDHAVDLISVDFHNNSNVKKNYDKIRAGLLGQRGMSKDDYVSGTMREEIRDWLGNEAFSRFAENGWQGGNSLHGSQSTMGLHLTGVVRLWGLLHEFDIHDLGEQWYGLQGEKRTFPSYRTVFNTAPHILGTNNPSNGQPAESFYTIVDESLPWYRDWDGASDSWYQMQVILNGGQRNSLRGGHHVVDWKYITYFGNAGAGRTSWGFKYDPPSLTGSPMYALAMGWKSLQEGDTGFGPDGAGSNDPVENRWWGYALREVRPSIANLFSDPFNGMSKPEIAAVLEPIYSAFITTFCTFTLDQWAKNADEFGGPTTYTFGVDNGQDKYQEKMPGEARRMRDDFGVSHAIVNALMDMGAFKWPGTNNANLPTWNNSRAAIDSSIGVPSGVTVTAAPGHMQVSWAAVPGATSYNIYRTRISDGYALPAGLLVKGTSFKEPRVKNGEQLSFSVSANVGVKVGSRSGSVAAVGVGGLVLHYTFNDDGGSEVKDRSGNDFWGKLISRPGRVGGAQGGGVKLSGNAGFRDSSFVSSSQNLAQWLNRSCTLSFRAKRFANGKNSDPHRTQVLIGGSYNGARAATTSIGALLPDGKLAVRYYGGSTVATGSAMKLNEWQHVTITRNETSGEVKIYLDGQLAGSGTSGSGYQIGRSFSIGRADNFSPNNAYEFFRYFPATIDDVRIYNQVLGAAQVSSLAATVEEDLSPDSITASYSEWTSLVDWGAVGPSQQSANSDPDGDGRSNADERAMGTDPSKPDVPKFPKIAVSDEGMFQLRFRKFAGEMQYEILHKSILNPGDGWDVMDEPEGAWDAEARDYVINWNQVAETPRQFFAIRTTENN